MAGELTLVELQTDLRYALDNRSDIPAPQLTRWLQRAYRHVGQPDVFRHRELQSTTTVTLVDGTYTYALPDDLAAVYTLRNTTVGFKIRPRSYMFLQELTRHTGRPAYYALWERQLVLFPTPDSVSAGHTLDLSYWRRVPALAASGPASILAPEWDEVIIEGATWRGWVALNQPQRAVESRENFAGLINEMSQLLRVDGEDSGFAAELEGLDNYMDRG